MFDLEKFKTGKYYVHLPTQELYDEAMKFLDDNGITWITGNRTTKRTNEILGNNWRSHTTKTCIKYNTVNRGTGIEKGIVYSEKEHWAKSEYKELSFNLDEEDIIKEIFKDGKLYTEAIKDYIDYKFEEKAKEESYGVFIGGDDYSSKLKFGGSLNLEIKKPNDMVKSPNHYIGDYGLEVEEVLRNFIGRYEDGYVAHRMASAIEYILRSPLKNGTQDLEKAGYNIQQALEHIKRENEDD